MIIRYLEIIKILLVCSVCSDKNDNTLGAKDLKQVHTQYTNLPYPFVNTKRERKIGKLHQLPGPHIQELNHFIYKGNGDLGRTKVFRILIAGGGTGASLLHYAYIFKHYKVEIIYLDFSKKSMEIARERVKNYGYSNIKFYHNSIFNIPKMNLGSFDLIDCYGVLHHLSDPDEGLQILENNLAPDGGMFLMVYAYYGRQGTYTMQNTLQILNDNMKNISNQQEIKRGRVIYNNLQENNWVHVSGIFLETKQDPGFYDMYLHKQDQAFTIPDLYKWVEKSGRLHIVDFYDPQQRYVQKRSSEIYKKLTSQQKYAVNEIIYGHSIKQNIFVSRKNNTTASLNNFENVPCLQFKNHQIILNALSSKPKARKLKVTTNTEAFVENSFIIPISKYSIQFFKLLMVSKLSIREIINHCVNVFKKIHTDHQTLKDKIFKAFKKEMMALIRSGLVLLRHKSYPDTVFSDHNLKIVYADVLVE